MLSAVSRHFCLFVFVPWQCLIKTMSLHPHLRLKQSFFFVFIEVNRSLKFEFPLRAGELFSTFLSQELAFLGKQYELLKKDLKENNNKSSCLSQQAFVL